MLSMDLATAEAHLAAATAAYTDALGAYSEGVGDLTVTHQKLDLLAGEMARWQRVVDALTQKAQAGTDGGVAIGTLTPKWSR
jgi:LDH2 family malate/lactate/ureidoglycolate dehydrogenase